MIPAVRDSAPPSGAQAIAAPAPLSIPRYLDEAYWWAYVHPNALRAFERKWLVNLILFGNYGRLRDAALADLGRPVTGRTLQVACVYGDLTARLLERLDAEATLDVVDILPIQLRNLAAKLPADERVALLQADSSSLACPDASYDQVLIFFLLHEQPTDVRRGTLAEALRVVRPGGKIVIVDYGQPAPLHPLRPLMAGVFGTLEPFARDLWRHPITDFLPAGVQPAAMEHRQYFGGLYQKLVVTR